ncbi:hypothetical protein NMY22_g17040 [Coprinellus aureogranulatus]|nr:hypothetical protein NMY22_g17040 [Coprinellus aureogranulatus]
MPQYSTPARSGKTPFPALHLESPCERRSLAIRPQRTRRLPRMYRDMVTMDPFIGTPLRESVSRVERRLFGIASLASPIGNADADATFGDTHAIGATTAEVASLESSTGSPSISAQLDESATRNARLTTRISRLQRANCKLKEKLQDRLEALKDARMEAEAAQTNLMKVEEAHSQLALSQARLGEMKESVKGLKREVRQFRRWWLAEYTSLKVVVSLLPASEDVTEISSSADARFASFST